MVDQGRARLAAMFAAARTESRAVVLPFMTAGLPDPESSVTLFEAMAEAGADGFEVGIPYSDPLMDGPVIQEAGARALAMGTSLEGGVAIAGRVAAATRRPVLVMTYVNPILAAGPEAFAVGLAAAGVDGVIVADLPADEAGEIQRAVESAGLGMALFAAPTTDDDRIAAIVAARPTFVYAIAELGVTGERAEASGRAAELARRIKAVAEVPVVLGVGISTPAQVAEAAAVADGVIVGSALVRRVLEATDARDAATSLREAVTALVAAARR